jgi:hypothetical protein
MYSESITNLGMRSEFEVSLGERVEPLLELGTPVYFLFVLHCRAAINHPGRDE